MNDQLPEPTCSDCKAFFDRAKDVNGNISGRCGRRPELGDVPQSMRYCHLFMVLESRAGQVREVVHQKPRASKRREAGSGMYETRDVATLTDPVTGDTDGEISMDRDGLKQVIREILEEETMYGFPELAGRWENGTLVIKSGDPELQPKEIPIDTFFHKIVMVRDRLRVLESKVNGNKGISEQDKIELQGYITKCYGTLTTFNVLFKHKADQFSSK